MPVRIKGISTADGRTVEVIVDASDFPDDGNGEKPLRVSSLVRYSYSSVATPPPNTTQVRTDTPTVTDLTKVWMHRLDYDNRDEKFWLMQLKTGNKLFFQDINDSDSRAILVLTEDPVDDGDYVTFTVRCESTSGVPLAGTGILIGLIY